MDGIKFTQSARVGDSARRVWSNLTNLLAAAVSLPFVFPPAGAGGPARLSRKVPALTQEKSTLPARPPVCGIVTLCMCVCERETRLTLTL